MMYVVIIACVIAILLIVTDGFKEITKNRTSDDRHSKLHNQMQNDEGTHFGKTATFFGWLFSPRRK